MIRERGINIQFKGQRFDFKKLEMHDRRILEFHINETKSYHPMFSMNSNADMSPVEINSG